MRNMDDPRKAPRWRGGVERRDPAAVRRPCIQLIAMCRNVYCRLWHPGARCPQCGERRAG